MDGSCVESLRPFLTQLAVRLLMTLLRFLLAPQRFGLARMMGANERSSFHANLLLGDTIILSRISAKRDLQDALAARGMRLILLDQGG